MNKHGIAWIRDQKHYITAIRTKGKRLQVQLFDGKWKTVKQDDIVREPMQ